MSRFSQRCRHFFPMGSIELKRVTSGYPWFFDKPSSCFGLSGSTVRVTLRSLQRSKMPGVQRREGGWKGVLSVFRLVQRRGGF